MIPGTSFGRGGVLGLDALVRADAEGAVKWLEPAVATVTDGCVGHPNYHRLDADLTGEHLQRRGPTTADRLTPQELQITLLVAEGLTNRDVGARLFLSPRPSSST